MALLKFTCIDANVTVSINTSNSTYNNVFQYRKNGEGDWSGFTSVDLTPDDYIELKANGFDGNSSSNPIFTMSGTGKIEAYGDITSLLNGIGSDVAITEINQFSNMFKDCTNLTVAPELPSTI